MDEIRDYLSYDPDTGVIVWIKKPTNRNIKIGSVAGGLDTKGYVCIRYKGKCYKAHRLAWYFTYGYMPDCDIDHKNEDPSDNRICNLRLDINRENEQNISKPRTNNKSGYRGVTWHKATNKWRAQITIKGKQIYLGLYDTPEEAHEAYLCAKRKYHPFWVENKKVAA